MKATVIKCDLCKTDICDKSGACVFAVHKRVIDGKEYHFCCQAHADRFEREKKGKKK
jgi:YHS domain-containing protein